MTTPNSLPFQEKAAYSLSGVEVISYLPFLSSARDKRVNLDTKCFISGYPGSPLGGLDLAFGKQKKYFQENQVVLIPGVNEELAATSVMGSQFATTYDGFSGDGVLGLWYGKAPGLERAMDAIRHGVYGGTGGSNAVLLFVGDDPASNSSSIPTSSSNLLADMNIPVIFPGHVSEILPLSLHAINISRVSGLWAAMKINTSVADSFSSVTLDSNVVPPLDLTLYPNHDKEITKMDRTFLGKTNATEKTILEKKMPLVVEYLNNNPTLNKTITSPDNPSLGIILAGNIYYNFVQALNLLGLDLPALQEHGVRILKLDVIFPLSPETINAFALDLDSVIVIEEKKNFVEQQILNIIFNSNLTTKVYGKKDRNNKQLIPSHGLMSSTLLKDLLPTILSHSKYPSPLTSIISPPTIKYLPISLKEDNPKRVPSLCSGCPHSTSLLLPEGSNFGAGVGCHALGMFMDKDLVGQPISSNSMGSEGAVWIGASPFLNQEHLFQNMGDGTYFHSGSLALRACIDSGTNITFKILYNSSIAMTGGQKVPGSIEIVNLIHELQTLNISKIILASNSPSSYKAFKFAKNVEVKHIDEIVSIQESLSTHKGVTVLISDLECALALRSKRKKQPVEKLPPRVVINSRICENCGDCGSLSSCLSLQPHETEFGTKVTIDQSSCNQALTCIKGNCPAFITLPASAILPEQSLTTIHSLESILPLPKKLNFKKQYNIVMPGIGGTGVIHASKLLGLASQMEGYTFSGTDSTGLAQKSGSVSSLLQIFKLDEVSTYSSDNIIDLLLGFDISVTSNMLPDLSFRDSSQAIISSSLTPTGNMVYNPVLLKNNFSKEIKMIKQINQNKLPIQVNSVEIARLIGNESVSNIVLLGAALQLGYLPTSYYSLVSAIKNSNNLVSQNIDALNLGRLSVANPSLLAKLLNPIPTSSRTTTALFSSTLLSNRFSGISLDLVEKIAFYANDLTDYHSKKYAEKFLTYLDVTSNALTLKFPGQDLDIALSEIIINTYKLMAFKDEFEVSRLTLLSTENSLVKANMNTKSPYSYLWKLPLVKYKNSTDKTKISSSLNQSISLLAKLKFIRFTPLNPFYFNSLRVAERKLNKRYQLKLNSLLSSEAAVLDEINLLNSQVQKIKGFGDLKSDLIAKYLP